MQKSHAGPPKASAVGASNIMNRK